MVLTGSSGDLIVDRRLSYAMAMAADGDLVAAIGILIEALDRVPDWAAGWFLLGEWHHAAGDPGAAARAWDAALRADPADTLGAGLKRDLARAVPVAEALPAAFVETLFDQYADRFDTALTQHLDYCAPGLLGQALDEAFPSRRWGRVMDLGCGTGLMGAAIRARADWLEGCDLSAQMLAQARAKGLYDALEKADLAHLAPARVPYDLILAADVFPYLGAIEHSLGWCAASLAPGGVLAFTVEADDSAPLTLRESRRFAHSRAYLVEVLAAAGFAAPRIGDAVLRKDRGEDVHGLVVLAGGPVPIIRRQGEGEGLALA